MAHLTLLKERPETPGTSAPVLLGILSAVLAVVMFTSDPPNVGAGVLGLMGIPVCLLVRRAAGNKAQRIIASHESFLARAQSVVSALNEATTIPTIDVPFNLQKAESCHWQGAAEWYELRKQTTRINYSGFTVSVPVMRGVRYRIGSIAPSIESREALALIDSGTLYVTDKRIFFDGRAKNVTLAFRTLAGVQLFLGGLTLEKQTGRSPTLLIKDDAETAAALIARGMSDEH